MKIEFLLPEGKLTTDYLMTVHPELTDEMADKLLFFANSKTIRSIECYGDGSIIYPKWCEHVRNISDLMAEELRRGRKIKPVPAS